MGLLSQIEADVAEAMKAKEEIRLSTLRLLRAAIKNAEIEQRTKGDKNDYDPEQMALAVIKRQLKQTEEAQMDFSRGNRADLVERAVAEIAVLKKYLPAQMSDEEISKLVDAVVAEIGATPNAIGKIIGEVVKRAAGAADGGKIRELVQKKLTAP